MFSPVYAYQKQLTMIDFRGHLSALFFTSGCNFACGFCHNADLMRHRQKLLTWERLEAVCRDFRDNWVDAATISGGEPLLQQELPQLIDFFKSFGFAVKLDSNGSLPAMLEKIMPLVDYIAMDIKCPLQRYAELTGYKHTDNIKKSIDLLKSGRVDYEFRTTLIDSFHSDADIDDMLELIKGARRYVLQPFVPQPHLPVERFRNNQRTSPDRLEAVAERARQAVPEVLVRGDE